MPYRKIDSVVKEQICQMYLDGYPGTQINQKFNINIKTVYAILNKYKINIKSAEDCKRKYQFNHNYFNVIDCYEKAYWLGFIAEDGGIIGNALIFNLSIYIILIF